MNQPAETTVLQVIIIIVVAATVAVLLQRGMRHYGKVSHPTMIAVPCDCMEV